MRARARWSCLLAAAAWCGLIFASSSTVILPHRLFAWVGSHVLTDDAALRGFKVFWGVSWFAIVKGWHAAEYAILFTLTRGMLGRFPGSRPGRDIGLAMAFCLTYAMSDEYHQTFVPGRGGNWTDVAIDGVGAGLAALLAFSRRKVAGRIGMVDRNPEDSWTSETLSRGDVEAVRRRVLADPTYPTSRDSVGDTPLLTAIDFNDPGLVEFMLRHGADPDPVVDDGYTSLLSAIESEEPASFRIVSMLIEAGADIHRPGTNGWTPLHMAAARGHVEKARLLIDAGAEVDRRNEIDAAETPLMEAAHQGRAGTVRLLLGRGADPTLRDTIFGRTPIEIARESMKGHDPDVLVHIAETDYGPIHAEILASLDVPPESREMIEATFAKLDMAGQYREAADKLAREGDFAEVIRLLSPGPAAD